MDGTGIFAGGMPGNGPLVYSEDFQKDLPSAMGIASIGRALAALSMGPVSSMSILMLRNSKEFFLPSKSSLELMKNRKNNSLSYLDVHFHSLKLFKTFHFSVSSFNVLFFRNQLFKNFVLLLNGIFKIDFTQPLTSELYFTYVPCAM